MKTLISLLLLVSSTTVFAGGKTCNDDVKNGCAVVHRPGYADQIEMVKKQLAKKERIEESRLTYDDSASFGDGAASFTVIIFRLDDKKGEFKGFYSVTAYDGAELTSYTLIAP